MSRKQLDTVVRQSIRRTELIRALLIGVLAAGCLLTAAYVNLATGLWLAILSFTVTLLFWQLTERKQQEPIAEQVTIPELNQAFERMSYALRGSLPEEEITALYPEGCEVHCSDRVDGQWRGLPFTFANVEIFGMTGSPMFHGQWLIVRAGWPDCIRVSIREKDGWAEKDASGTESLSIVDQEMESRYQIESERAGDAAAILTEERLRSLLLSAEGIRLMVENGVLHLAMPSEDAFFAVSGMEQSAEEVMENTRSDIGVICSWLDRILNIEFR